jgi:hypothetical protein
VFFHHDSFLFHRSQINQLFQLACTLVQVRNAPEVLSSLFEVNHMTLGSDLLNLRRNKTSTVATLLGGIERLAEARSETIFMTRAFALTELGDAVLAKVAVYAVESYWGDAPLPKTRRSNSASRRNSRRYGTNFASYQRRLFA